MDINQAIHEELTGNETTQSSPLSVEINGQKITFNSPEELNQNLQEALNSVGNEYRQMKQQLAEYQAGLNQNPGQTVDTDDSADTGKFSQARYIELLRDNALEAAEYVDSHRYGIKEKPSEYIKQTLRQSEQLREESEVNRWIRLHPEFPGGEHAGKLDKVRQSLGLPMTAENLEVAYQRAIQTNVIPDFKTIAYLNQYKQHLLNDIQSKGGQLPDEYQQNIPQQQFQAPPQRPSNFTPPPSMPRPGGGQIDVNNEASLEQLSLTQLEAILKRAGAL